MKRTSKEKVLNLISEYEKENKKKKLNNELTKVLWQLIKENIDIDVIKEEYKKVLIDLKKYNNNYYANVCILLNSMKLNRERVLKYDLEINIETFSKIFKPMVGTCTMQLDKARESTITSYAEYIEFKEIKYKEGILKSNKELDKLLDKANEFLKVDRIDLDEAEKWKQQYEKYIIMNYGRCSKEYEEFMTIPFGLDIIIFSPNICLTARRDNFKQSIKEFIENRDQNYMEICRKN